MDKLNYGLQMYSVRNALAADEIGTLKRVAEIGYREIEITSPDFENGRPAPARSAGESRRIYRDLDLRVRSIAMPVEFHRELDDWKRLTEYSAEIGCDAICCSVATFASHGEALRLSDFFNQVGEYAQRNGQRFYYHNHFNEFQLLEGEAPLNTLLKNTDPRCVDFELDTFWAWRGGVDPVKYMASMGERVKLVHQKDLARHVDPVNMFERIPEGTVLDWDAFGRYAGSDPTAFTELGNGKMDLPALIEQIRATPSVESILIEQDQTRIGEFESAEINCRYMQKLLGRS